MDLLKNGLIYKKIYNEGAILVQFQEEFFLHDFPTDFYVPGHYLFFNFFRF